MPLISVIIPVYKVENYLHKCVNSVLIQNFKDIQVILVNDGSPDNCPTICDEIAQADARVIVIHKDNGGSSDARNVGIRNANGDYLMFLDSDDYWQGKDCLKNLVNSIELNQADVTLYGCKDVSLISNTAVVSRGSYDITAIKKNKETAIKSLFETGHFPGSAWVVTIKRSFVLQNKLFFETGIKAEDVDWLINVFVHGKTFDAVNDSFYMYIKNRPGSITNTSDLKSAEDILYSVSKWHQKLEKDLLISNKLLLSYLAYQFLTSFIIYSQLSKADRKMLKPMISSEIRIIKYLHGKKGSVGKLAVYLLGINGSSQLFRFIHKTTQRWPKLKNRLS